MPEITQKRHNRVFKSLHKPLTYMGIERTLFYMTAGSAVGMFNISTPSSGPFSYSSAAASWATG